MQSKTETTSNICNVVSYDFVMAQNKMAVLGGMEERGFTMITFIKRKRAEIGIIESI